MQNAKEKTILVVEDEPDVQLVLATALKDAGFNVMTASNGHEAYNQIKHQAPDLITLDLVMPRQSGPLLYKKLRTKPKYADVRVIIVSAHVHDDLGQEDFKELMKGHEFPPPNGYLEKPVNTVELVTKIGDMLDVDVSAFVGNANDESRMEIMSKIRKVDQSTLDKVREVLNHN